MVSTLIRNSFDGKRKLVHVECTECGDMTWNTYTKLCSLCYMYRDDI